MMSWAWSQWKKIRVAYYTYPRKSSLYWKSVNSDRLHKEFEKILESIQPKPNLIKAFQKGIELAMEERYKDEEIIQKNIKSEISRIENKITHFIKRIWETSSDILITSYENEIEKLEREKQKIQQKLQMDFKNVWTPLKNKLKYVENSLIIRKKASLRDKRNLIKNIFPNWIWINKKREVWTLNFSFIYQAFQVWKTSKIAMVEFIKNNLNLL